MPPEHAVCGHTACRLHDLGDVAAIACVAFGVIAVALDSQHPWSPFFIHATVTLAVLSRALIFAAHEAALAEGGLPC